MLTVGSLSTAPVKLVSMWYSSVYALFRLLLDTDLRMDLRGCCEVQLRLSPLWDFDAHTKGKEIGRGRERGRERERADLQLFDELYSLGSKASEKAS